MGEFHAEDYKAMSEEARKGIGNSSANGNKQRMGAAKNQQGRRLGKRPAAHHSDAAEQEVCYIKKIIRTNFK